MTTPSEQLAERALQRLVEQKLLLPDDVQRYFHAFAVGELRAEDWRLMIEKAIDKRENNE